MPRSFRFELTATLLLAVVWGCRPTSSDTSTTSAAPMAATSQNSNAWLEISQPAFEHNLAEVKSLVGPKTQICAVLKADATATGSRC